MAKISFWVRIIRASLVAVTISTLFSGCSSLKFAYNQLPEISSWWLDSYVNFNDKQAAEAKVALKSLQAWHRKEELPLLAPLLVQAQGQALKDITTDQACELWSQASKRIEAVTQESVRLATPILIQLTSRQLQHLEKQWRVKNEDWKKEWLTPSAEERLKKRTEATADRFSSFYGTLTDEQIKLINQQAMQSTWTPEWGLQMRIKRQQEQMQVLQSLIQEAAKPGFSISAAEKTLFNVSMMSVRPQDPAALQKQLQLEKQACENFAQFHNSTSASQRQKAQRKLKSYETDLKDLIKAGF